MGYKRRLFRRRTLLSATLAASASFFFREKEARATQVVPVRKGYARGRFGLIHYRISQPSRATGQPPLICFHMSPRSGRIYENLLKHIGGDRFAVAPDTPGFGDSDPPSQVPEIDDYAAAMGELIDALGFKKVDVLGYHTGSQIAIELARRRPNQVRRVVLISVPIYTAQEQVEKKAQFARERLTSNGSHIAKRWRSSVRWAMPGVTLLDVAEQFADTQRRPTISWWGHNAAFSYPCGQRLASIEQPVLVLNPEDDLHDKTKRAEQHLRHGQIQTLPGWGHGFLDLFPGRAAAVIRQHLG